MTNNANVRRRIADVRRKEDTRKGWSSNVNATREAANETARRAEKELERKLRETPQLPKMRDSVDIEMFLIDFEQHMTDLEIPRERWITNLRPLLSDWARAAIDIIGEESRRDYTAVKEALLSSYASIVLL